MNIFTYLTLTYVRYSISLGFLGEPATWGGMPDWLAPCWAKPCWYFCTRAFLLLIGFCFAFSP